MATASSGRDAWDEQKGKPSSRAAWRPDGSAVSGQQWLLQHVVVQDIPRALPRAQDAPRTRPAVAHPVFPRARRVCGVLGLLAGQCAQSPRLGPRVSQDCAALGGLGVFWAGRACPRTAWTADRLQCSGHDMSIPLARVQPPSCARQVPSTLADAVTLRRVSWRSEYSTIIIPQRRCDLCEATDRMYSIQIVVSARGPPPIPRSPDRPTSTVPLGAGPGRSGWTAGTRKTG